MRGSLFAIALLAASIGVAHAQVIKFNGTTLVNANGSVTPTLTWCTELNTTGEPAGSTTCANPGAASACTASGGWTGTKAAAGTQAQTSVSTTTAYNLSCTWPGADSITLSWLPPTTNTDGSTLTDLAGFKIQYGTSVQTLDKSVDVPSAGATSKMIGPGLAPGSYFLTVSAYNSGGAESTKAPSPPLSKTLATGATVGQVFKVTFPNAPTNVTVQ